MLDGEYDIAIFPVPGGGEACLHEDIPAARRTMAKIRLLEKDFGFHIALSHDASWLKERKDTVLMSLLDDDMRRAAQERIPKAERP